MVNYIFLFIGIFLLGLGILILKGKLVDMIAGFDEKKDDKLMAGKWVGSNLITMALIVILGSLITSMLKIQNPLIIFCISIGAVIIFSLRSSLLYNKKVCKCKRD